MDYEGTGKRVVPKLLPFYSFWNAAAAVNADWIYYALI